MENKIILLDTSILIEFYRKSNKENTIWISLVRQGYNFAVSAVAKFEIYSGATAIQIGFWDKVMQKINVLPFDSNCVDKAVEINANLKRKRKQIAIADLFIAATALSNNLPVATLNKSILKELTV